MKIRHLVLAFGAAFAVFGAKAQNSDPVLMKIGNQTVTKSEFEYIYFKNNSANSLDKKNLDEYVELFKKFKLKVIEAEALGLDTLPSFKREFNGYRSQLTEPYLSDTSVEEKLAEEAYNRLSQDIEISHILLQLPREATPADTLAAYNKALEICKRLQKEDFAKVADETSQDPSVTRNHGYIGWLTGQMVAYQLEKAMYEVPVSKISAPVRVPYGYHIIKILNKRPAVGKVDVAHIMKKFPENATPEQQQQVYNEIVEIEKTLTKDNFAEKAKQFSDDKGSARNGGDLGFFGLNRMVPEFEKEAFALKEKGEISKPVKTQFGWHILMLIDKKGIGTFDELKPEILKQFKNDERKNAGRKALAQKVKKEYGYEFYQPAFDEIFSYAQKYVNTDTVFLSGSTKFQKPLFKIGAKTVPQEKYIYYVYTKAKSEIDSAPEDVLAKINDFIDEELIAYEDSQLEKKYPDLKNLLQEYHDGILLFNISNEKVWDKAVRDKEGLQEYFEQNKKNYVWNIPHFKGRVFFCTDKNTAKEVEKTVKKLPVDSVASYLAKRVNKDSVLVDSQYGLWKKGDNKAIDKYGFKDKKADFTPNEKFPYVFILGKVLDKMPENYTDVRGAVTSDYQNFLEDEWLKLLFEKYPIDINQSVLREVEADGKTVLKNE
ncbi:MAG: peptidylprolyl isomerase [Prevotellaceae bacterium]|jgi:peptidyl-prolyl cis-trans isomerase SurA|nr:peptidylprolyl isomerase [Prevotellaceae bacterium]